MIPVLAGTRVWLASGVTDMRKGCSSLSLLVQEQMKLDPHTGHLFVFRGRKCGLIKVDLPQVFQTKVRCMATG